MLIFPHCTLYCVVRHSQIETPNFSVVPVYHERCSRSTCQVPPSGAPSADIWSWLLGLLAPSLASQADTLVCVCVWGGWGGVGTVLPCRCEFLAKQLCGDYFYPTTQVYLAAVAPSRETVHIYGGTRARAVCIHFNGTERRITKACIF